MNSPLRILVIGSVARGDQWSRALSNSAIECRVLWNQLPELGKDCSRATGLWAGWIVPQRQRCYARGGTAQPGQEALHCGANAPATPRQDERHVSCLGFRKCCRLLFRWTRRRCQSHQALEYVAMISIAISSRVPKPRVAQKAVVCVVVASLPERCSWGFSSSSHDHGHDCCFGIRNP